MSDAVPYEASYSRLLMKLENSNILVEAQEKVVLQAIAEGFIFDDTVAIDATHFEARDQAPPKEEKPKEEPKRGRKSKKEREQWLIKQARVPLNCVFFMDF